MMRRAFLWTALLALLPVLPGSLQAANSCASARSGNWSDPGAWLTCGGGVPGPADTVTIKSGHTITFDINTVSGDTVSQISILQTATLRFPAGDHRLQVSYPTPYAISNEGTISVSNGSVIALRSDSGVSGFTAGNHSEFNSDGVSLGSLRTVESMSINSNAQQCGGTEQWNLLMSATVTGLVPGDLLQFASGGAQGRMYEIVAIQSKTIKLCPMLPDAVSLGPRLTPHAPTLGTYQPGIVPVQVPAAGDAFWAWHPWRIVKAGSSPWIFSEAFVALEENNGRLEWIGGDISGFGDTGNIGVQLECGVGRPPVVIRHNNVHDHAQSIVLSSGLTSRAGCDRPNLTWNVIHDGTVEDGNFHLGIGRSGAGPVTGGVIAWNTFYRTSNNNINVNAVNNDYPIEGFDVAYNTGFDLGIAGFGECEFIEIDVMQDTVIELNRAWRVPRECAGISAKPFPTTSAFMNNLVRWNYIQGGYYGIDLSTAADLYRSNVARGNYLANPVTFGLRSWHAYGNMIHAWSAGNPNYVDRYAIFAVRALGNFMDGTGSTGAFQGLFSDVRGNPSVPTLFRDNVVRGLAEAPGQTACVMVSGNAAQSADILHNVCDCDLQPSCIGYQILPELLPDTPVTVSFKDNVVFDVQSNINFGGAAATDETVSSNVTASLQNLTRWPLNAQPGWGSWSFRSGENARDPAFVDPERDFNYLAQSSEQGAGSTPPGSSIGVRGAFYDTALFPGFVQAAMSLPVDIHNDSITDADGDGVLQDLDNCPDATNTLQEDDDADGAGNVCDPCTDADGDGFGSPLTVASLCPQDNCPAVSNPSQLDSDADGIGDPCDACPLDALNDADADGRCADVDNCEWIYNPLQEDPDGDVVGTLCDNCPLVSNRDQTDLDGDSLGDACDLSDGFILVTMASLTTVSWQLETGYQPFNVYQGDVSVLRSTGVYTQDPATVPLAKRTCGAAGPNLGGVPNLAVGKTIFILVTGKSGGVESSLGMDSSGFDRPNTRPCP